jgi:acyl phosphate:glycerol-3-phosphate acyltransferase
LHAMIFPAIGLAAGSIPFSWILGRLAGIDLRRYGSGNAGATNLLRACGWRLGAAGLLLDVLKGTIPTLAATSSGAPAPAAAGTALAAVAGHVFTPWLGFRGGKGVATALGGLLVLAPLPVLIALAVFAAVLAIWRFVSLGSIAAAASLVPLVFVFPVDPVIRLVCCAVAAVLIVRHAGNIRRLASGGEHRMGGGRGA